MQRWQDLQRRQDREGPSRPAPHAEVDTPEAPAPMLSPRVQHLLQEREALEQQMQRATGGDPALEARRYPVASAAERRAEHRAWEARRVPAQPQAPVRPRSTRPAEPSRLPASPRPEAFREPGTPVSPKDWYAQRDARRTEAWQRASTPELRPRAERSPDPVRKADGVAPATDRTRLDRVLEGAFERAEARPEARRQATEPLARLEKKVEERVQGPRKAVEAPLERTRGLLEAGERVAKDWDRRREALAGPDLARVAEGFEARKARLLDVETGGLAAFGERADALRERALSRRAESQKESEKDEARRERALMRRQARRESGEA